jgi:hypothetical protein
MEIKISPSYTPTHAPRQKENINGSEPLKTKANSKKYINSFIINAAKRTYKAMFVSRWIERRKIFAAKMLKTNLNSFSCLDWAKLEIKTNNNKKHYVVVPRLI